MADVDIGVFLSGGIDSVTMAYFASRHKTFNTFTVFSQSTLSNGDAFHARKAAREFGLANHQIIFDWRTLNVTPANWKKILWKVETPMAGAEQLYKYCLHAYAKSTFPGTKVILLGSGSDEFNGGYSKTVYNTSDEPNWQTFVSVMRDYERRSWLYRGETAPDYLWLSSSDKPAVSEEFLAELASQPLYEHPWHGYRDMYRYLLQMYQLWHEDRTSAAHGLENRVPFLDHRLVELTYAVPAELYSELFWDKMILRRAMSKSLSRELWGRPKVPFFCGEDERYTRRMLHNMLCAQGMALLEEATAGAVGSAILNRDVLRRALRRDAK